MLEDDFFLGTKLYQKRFAELCKPVVDYMGVTSAHYVNMDRYGRMLTVYTLPNWGERVLEKQHYKTEAVMVHPNKIGSGFSFCSASNDTLYKDTLLYDGGVNFGWWHAFAYIEKTPGNGGFWGLGFATTKENYQMIQKVVHAPQIIKKFMKNLNKELMLSMKDLEDQRMDCAALKGDAFYTQQGLVFDQELEQKDRIALLKELALMNDKDLLIKPSLSPQEITCLRAYMNSRNLKEVAIELGLEASTVESHLENIKRTLNCNLKQELLQKASVLETLGYL